MSRPRFLVLGGGQGWHSEQLQAAASDAQCEIRFASYESLAGRVEDGGSSVRCDAGELSRFDAVLTRTMPAGSLEQITFRLATLHDIESSPNFMPVIVNSPRSLEIAIDKYATLARIARLGYRVPETSVGQDRASAMDAFERFGSDCVIKPIFGGEGRGVMRIQNRELARYTFATLEQLGAVIYVQRFVPPGGKDTRLLVVGNQVIGIRRENSTDFRTNVASGGRSHAIQPTEHQIQMAQEICRDIGLQFASVDLLDDDSDQEHGTASCVVEVNGIPGWKGAQSVVSPNIAHMIVGLLALQSARKNASARPLQPGTP